MARDNKPPRHAPGRAFLQLPYRSSDDSDSPVTVFLDQDAILKGDTSAADVAYNLPSAADCIAGAGFYFEQVGFGGNDLILNPDGTDTIQQTAAPYNFTSSPTAPIISAYVVTDGVSDWQIIAAAAAV